MFRILFAAAVSDCYLNGPFLRDEEKFVAIAISIGAVLINAQYGFLLAYVCEMLVPPDKC